MSKSLVRHPGESDAEYSDRLKREIETAWKASYDEMLRDGTPANMSGLHELVARKMAELMADPDIIDVRGDHDDPTRLIVTRRCQRQLPCFDISFDVKIRPENAAALEEWARSLKEDDGAAARERSEREKSPSVETRGLGAASAASNGDQ